MLAWVCEALVTCFCSVYIGQTIVQFQPLAIISASHAASSRGVVICAGLLAATRGKPCRGCLTASGHDSWRREVTLDFRTVGRHKGLNQRYIRKVTLRINSS